mgnify:CR=1 FL=1
MAARRSQDLQIDGLARGGDCLLLLLGQVFHLGTQRLAAHDVAARLLDVGQPKAGDVVLEINGVSTLSVPDAAALLRNQAGRHPQMSPTVVVLVEDASAPLRKFSLHVKIGALLVPFLVVGLFFAGLFGKALVTHQTGPEGRVVKTIYVEAGSDIEREMYVALVMDRSAQAPVIIAAKHQSAWETIAYVATMPRPLCYVFKKELLLIPFFGWAIGKLDMIHIDRSKRAEAWAKVAEQGKRISAMGNWVIMFPEGTRIARGSGAGSRARPP